MNPEQQKISIKEKVGYSVGDTASNLFFQTFIYYILIFYTDVFGITAKAAGTMFLITKIWDAVNDPMMGMIADRTSTRWGKFRPYLIWGAIPFGVLGVLTFTTPELSSAGKLIYAYITYTLLMMAYTAINVPYSAIMGVITPNSHERTSVSSFRFVAAFIALFFIQYFIPTMTEDAVNPAKSWQLAYTIISGLAVVLFVVAFFSCKERVQPPKGQKTSFKQDLTDLISNKPWLLIGAATIFQLIFLCMRGGSTMYYFKYFVQDQQMTLFGKAFSLSYLKLFSVFTMSGTAFTIIGAILTPRISKIFGKSLTYATFLGIAGITSGLFIFLGPQSIVLMLILQLITSFAVGPVSVLQWAIYTDTADYSEWKKGRRATGLVMSASLFALKLGIALGATANAWILAAYGYQPNIEQTAKGLLGIRMVMSVYPSIFAVIGMVIMFFYPLKKHMMMQVETELVERRKEAKND
ncbi:MAG TPA: MFS transporter [Sedimentisphaerales bacterium]|nr:MFS transporter [Sedimentisphaerales bacterium]